MNEKKSLLEKYSIPIEHLDFDYIKKCGNSREIEKIFEVLKSSEEGYYPDLTKFAEDKLRELDPDNHILRIEVKCQQTSTNERLEIYEFVESIKEKDRKIRAQSDFGESSDDTLPPVRIVVSSSDAKNTQTTSTIKSKRIDFTEYEKWDKFDADTECMKIDLAEEQMREKTIIQQKQHAQKSKLIEVLPEKTAIEKMNDTEKKEFADKHRIKGNEFFKCGDFQQAIIQYSTSLTYDKTAAVYNNRAIAHLKLKKYKECIQDCDECLMLDTVNVKAMLRKCDALMSIDQKNDAYQQYSIILSIEPENTIAKKALKNISLRLEIQDVNVQESKIILPDGNSSKDDDDLYKKLIIPNKIVPSKFSRAVSNVRRHVIQRADSSRISNEQINF